MFPHARRALDGPPFVLPVSLDRLSERWWRARPRTRAALLACSVALVLLAGATRLLAPPHGPPAVALVATRDLGVGAQLGPGDLRRTSWPSDLLPDAALTEPAGTLVAPLPRGAVATDRHVGEGGPVAGIPGGMAVVPLPVDALPTLPAGARLDLVAGDHARADAQLVAHDALVLHDDGVAVWVAVDEADAARLAAAALHGSIGVVLIPP